MKGTEWNLMKHYKNTLNSINIYPNKIFLNNLSKFIKLKMT